MDNIKYSVVIPVHNEEGSLPPLYPRLTATMADLGQPYEIVFIDDGSTDRSFYLMQGLHEKDPHVRAVRFSRNFGHHIAITAGLDQCRGDVVILMDGDLQDKPEDIPRLIAKMNDGYDIVYASHRIRHDSLFKRFTSRFYLWTLGRMTNQAINPSIATFRAMSRRVVDYTNQFRERSRFYGGLVAWLGFPYALVECERDPRFSGKQITAW